MPQKRIANSQQRTFRLQIRKSGESLEQLSDQHKKAEPS